PDMDAETFTLPLQIALQPVVVQAGFSNAHYFRMACQFNELLPLYRCRIRIVRVHSDRGVEVVVSFGQCQYARELLEGYADTEGISYRRARHCRQYFRHTPVKILEIRMAM